MSIETETEAALKEFIEQGCQITPVSYPNRPGKTTMPRLELDVFRTPQLRTQINSGGGQYSGFAQITVVWETGVGTDAPNDMADTVKSWFPADMKIPINSGTIRITKTPDIRGGFPDDTSWRIPVDVNFEVLSTT